MYVPIIEEIRNLFGNLRPHELFFVVSAMVLEREVRGALGAAGVDNWDYCMDEDFMMFCVAQEHVRKALVALQLADIDVVQHIPC